MKKTINCVSVIPILAFFILISWVISLCFSQSANTARAAILSDSASCPYGTRFSATRTFPLGLDPEDLLAGDYNGDGLIDLAIRLGGQVSIYGGNGRGEFANVYNIQLPGRSYRLVQGDFNNDGKLDLATTSTGDDGGVVIALGRGDWTFSTTILPINFMRFAAGIAVADFNADGKTDIAFSGEGNLIVLAGDGKGTFVRTGSYSVAATPSTVAAADFNGDGKPDLLVFGEEFGQKPTLFTNDGTGHFQAGVTLSINGGSGVQNNAVGDLNGDGKADLAVVSLTSQQERGVTILFGTGAGGFGEPVQIPLGVYNYPKSLRIVDVNSDGKPDLIATEDFSNRVTILLGNGAGAFSVRASYSTGNFPIASAAADFDRDGKIDLAVISNPTLSVLTGVGNGEFLAPRGFDQADKLLRATALADINGDGRLDAVVAEGNQGGVLIAYGDGMGGFGSPKTYPTDRDNSDITVADFNKDGRPDIVVAGGSLQSPGHVTLLLANATGDFITSPRNLSAGQTPSTVINADFNRDGNQDLAIGNFGSNDISILLGDGAGNFAPAVNIPVGPSPSAIVSGDFDKDGKLDMIVANYGGTTLNILKGNGAGGFNSSSVTVAAVPLLLSVGDFNNDGKLDLAVIHRDESTTRNLSILLGNGDASFRAPLRFDVDKFPRSVAVGDFTGDGKLDLALTEVLSLGNTDATDHVSIYAGDGAGNFARATNVPIPIGVYLTGGDLNGDGMIDLAVTTRTGISATLATCNLPPVNTVASVSAASYLPVALAPDSIAAAFGTHLATATLGATNLPLPTELAGTRIRVKDATGTERFAPLFFVSPGQCNYLVPVGTASGLATITVVSGDGQTTTGIILITSTLPGLFTANADGAGPPAGYLLRVKSDGTQTTESLAVFDQAQNRYVPRPIDYFSDSASQPDQLYLVLFGSGLRNRDSLASVKIGINNTGIEALYAGPQGDFAGLDQVNVKLPQFSQNMVGELQVFVEGKSSNKLIIVFK